MWHVDLSLQKVPRDDSNRDEIITTCQFELSKHQIKCAESGTLPVQSCEALIRVAENANNFCQKASATHQDYLVSPMSCSCSIGFESWESVARDTGLKVELHERGISSIESVVYALSRLLFCWDRGYDTNPVALVAV